VAAAVAPESDSNKVTLHNQLGNVSFECFPRTPNNLGDILEVMAQAKRENRNVKAIGGFYAFSLVHALCFVVPINI
jgi:hypothetical protein